VPRTRPSYPPVFRRWIVELVRAGRTPEELAKEFEPSAQTIRTWANQDRVDAGERLGLTSEEGGGTRSAAPGGQAAARGEGDPP
jgi:transposase